MYSIATDPYTIYIKIDDDVVFFTKIALEEMVKEKLRGECGLVSANVVNHSILSAVHNELGAVVEDFGPTIESKDEKTGETIFYAPQIEKHAQSTCVWKRWECAEWVHKSFFKRYFERNLEAFYFYRY